MNLLTNSRNNMNYQIFNSKKELRNVMGVFYKASVLQLIYNKRSKSFREHYVSFDKIEKNCLYTTSISIRVNSDIEVLPKIYYTYFYIKDNKYHLLTIKSDEYDMVKTEYLLKTYRDKLPDFGEVFKLMVM